LTFNPPPPLLTDATQLNLSDLFLANGETARRHFEVATGGRKVTCQATLEIQQSTDAIPLR
jgi:hypothetical protein